MGVNSLWKVLDEAGCGKKVGAEELAHPNGWTRTASLKGVNPWNVGRRNRTSNTNNASDESQNTTRKSVLAVDLSIWICESLASGMADNHSNPAVHLVFSRTVKLLSMGIGLVFVIEGKRRIRDAGITSNDQADRFRKRRSGTAFWKACKNCHDMLQLLGVTVVRAKVEAEALCALLNQKGIVDAVISNDGDCLLFGAQAVYTKFSIDNLEKKKVVRYDSSELCATTTTGGVANTGANGVVDRCKLSRHDLFAFALLTGSDLAGSGLDKVGYKKAIRFIRKCQLDDPQNSGTAAIDELKSWARSVAPCDIDPFDNTPLVAIQATTKCCCSRCDHAGSKKDHLEKGCEVCGTQPGEPCLEITADDRFRQSLRVKALSLFPKFDPSQVVAAYMSPNNNTIPNQFSSNTLPQMKTPDLVGLMKMKVLVRGSTKKSSGEYVKTAVGRLLSRAELLRSKNIPSSHDKERETDQRYQANKPIPLEIKKRATVDGVPSYHVSWRVGASDQENNGKKGTGGHEYMTVEPQALVQSQFPKLVEDFRKSEKERNKQGDAEKNRRRAFLESLRLHGQDKDGPVSNPSPPKNKRKKRETFFEDAVHRDIIQQRVQANARKVAKRCVSEDVRILLQGIKTNTEKRVKRSRSPFKPTGEYAATPDHCQHGHSAERLDPDASPLFCHFGSYMIPMSPIEALAPNEFPPRHIYVHHGNY